MPVFTVAERGKIQQISFPTTLDTIEVDYPSQWFSKERNKPVVTIFNTTAALAFSEYRSMLISKSWNDKVVCSFMVMVILENSDKFSVEETEEWKSFKRHFVDKNAKLPEGKIAWKINPLILVDLNIEENQKVPDNVLPSTAETRLSDFVSLIAMYRRAIANQTESNYGALVSTKINNLLQGQKGVLKADSINVLAGFVSHTNLSIDYKKIIAAIDCFFHKYPDLEMAYLRIGTLPSRYKGLSALSSLGLIAHSLGLTIEQLGLFIFTDPIAEDYKRLGREGQEIEDLDGYFPYQSDFGLVKKSAYSVAVNPTLYLWLHTIGCMLGLPRSYNAKMPLNPCDILSTINTAVATALLLGRGGDLRPFAEDDATAKSYYDQYTSSRQQPTDSGTTSEDEANPEESTMQPGQKRRKTPKPKKQKPTPINDTVIGKRANQVLKYLSDNQGLSDDDRALLRKKFAQGKGANKNSVGRYLYDTFHHTN